MRFLEWLGWRLPCFLHGKRDERWRVCWLAGPRELSTWSLDLSNRVRRARPGRRGSGPCTTDDVELVAGGEERSDEKIVRTRTPPSRERHKLPFRHHDTRTGSHSVQTSTLSDNRNSSSSSANSTPTCRREYLIRRSVVGPVDSERDGHESGAGWAACHSWQGREADP